MNKAPTSFPQMVKLYTDAFGSPSNRRMQLMLANGDLLRALAMAAEHLADVDREAFKALLVPKPKQVTIKWGTILGYIAKIRDWNRRFQLGLSDQQIYDLFSALTDHASSSQPTGISLTLGQGLEHDWRVVMEVIEYELNKLGVRFMSYVDASYLSYYPGSEPIPGEQPQLTPVSLDLSTYSDLLRGIEVREVRRQRSRWPGLEVAWLLALNPRVLLQANGRDLPFLWAAGLVYGSSDLPFFGLNGGEAFVNRGWGGSRWDFASIVAFRE